MDPTNKVALIGAGYWRPDGIGHALRGRGVQLWMDWHDKGGIRDGTDYFEARQHAINRGAGLLIHIPADETRFRDERDLSREAADMKLPIFAFRTQAGAAIPDFLGEVPHELHDFFGPASADEAALDALAARLKALPGHRPPG